jgi:hypothetical protein
MYKFDLYRCLSSVQHTNDESTASKFRRDQLDELEKATQQTRQNRDDETKAKTRQSLLSLNAPVAGTVQQLSVHTLGGVVTTAQSLMEIVPDDALEVEARLENKDVGFVEVGQRAAVKIEAFPHTRFGFLNGTIILHGSITASGASLTGGVLSIQLGNGNVAQIGGIASGSQIEYIDDKNNATWYTVQDAGLTPLRSAMLGASQTTSQLVSAMAGYNADTGAATTASANHSSNDTMFQQTLVAA